MRQYRPVWLIIVLLVIGSEVATCQSPACPWPIASPEEEGISSSDLNLMFDYVRKEGTRVHSIQILRHGKLVLDS